MSAKLKHVKPTQPSAGESWVLYKRIFKFVKPYWRLGVLAIIAMILAAAGQTAFAWIMQPLVDGTFIEQDPNARLWVPAALVGIFLFYGITIFASDYSVAWIGRKVVKDIRQAVFEKYLHLPSAFFDRHSPGTLLAKLTYNVTQISSAASKAVVVLIRDTFTVIFLLAYMAYLSGWLVLIVFTIAPIVGLVITGANRQFRKISRRMQRSTGDYAQIAEDGIRGQAEVKIFGATDYEALRFEKTNERFHRQAMRHKAVQAAAQPLSQLGAVIALAVIVYLATMDLVLETITPGGMISFITAMLLMLPSLKRIVGVNAAIQKALAGGESVFEVLDLPAERDDGQRHLERALGDIEFDHVGFRYATSHKRVLEDISLTVKPGQTVALVGRSGSGKTTLARLLPRFYEIEEGEIRLDGHPIQEYRLRDLRAQLAMVSQHVVLFNDTLAHNLCYGMDHKPSLEQLREAADAANALEFIDELPEGFDTVVGENGIMLSGGQRQRVAIARALLKDAPILILDEATSALDSESEQKIQDALERLMENRTTLVIAHRLSTIESADHIVVLDRGRIVEAGSHAQLLEHNGHYAALQKTQFEEPPETSETQDDEDPPL
ncbi:MULTISPECIES: lipid A export permease/ATP-binding protein MsbA [unclassified Thioalkalivibrio]|uniref:lipid A export permease/ATP-binding protein MsbA n=1 Tax=unclassified Thioalkalivibrio TaxID=2621013 RepID=UPI000371D6D5|nr:MULTISPECIES: lipid A export permease/ATP-binding protein MsbA [unclassified Thioalkalivibrio]